MMERPTLTENARLIESYYYLYSQGIFTEREFAEIRRRLVERRRKEKTCTVWASS